MSESYAYDVDGARIKKSSGGVDTRTWFPFYEQEGGTVVKHYSFAGQRIAVKRGSTLRYIHGDHLGSSSIETDGSGNQTASRSYYAYGSTRSSSGSLQTDRTFTGQKSDGTGLLYYNARYYDSALGTFLSPDTIVPDAGAVIDYNRFLYVRGNPLKYSDPSGHCAVLDDGSPDRIGDWSCWDAADEWFGTFEARRGTDRDEWNQTFAGQDFITEEILRAGLSRYWSPLYRQWGVYHQHYNPAPQWHDAPPPPDVVSKLEDLYRSLLSSCARAVAGTCGVSYGGTGIIPGAAGRVSGDFYVDMDGEIALYGSFGAGPSVMLFPQPMASHGVSFVSIPGATVNDVGGFSIQVGASASFVQGPAADLIVAVSEYSPTGVAFGSAYGTWNAEAHVILSYSTPLYSSRR